MKMDKLKSVQYRRVVSGHSEPWLGTGYMTKKLLKFKSLKNECKNVRDKNRQTKECAMCRHTECTF